MKHVFCDVLLQYSLAMEYSVAWKAAILTFILHMPWDPDNLIGCIFIFRIHLSSMKNLCVLKRIIWKFPLPIASVSWLLKLGNPGKKKPLALCKIACVSTVNADTPQTVIMHHTYMLVNSCLPLLCPFPFFVKKCYCIRKLNGWWPYLSIPSLVIFE